MATTAPPISVKNSTVGEAAEKVMLPSKKAVFRGNSRRRSPPCLVLYLFALAFAVLASFSALSAAAISRCLKRRRFCRQRVGFAASALALCVRSKSVMALWWMVPASLSWAEAVARPMSGSEGQSADAPPSLAKADAAESLSRDGVGPHPCPSDFLGSSSSIGRTLLRERGAVRGPLRSPSI